MPELPDITVYIEALSERVIDKELQKVRLTSPFFVRSFDPPVRAVEGRTVRALQRIGKRIVFDFDDELYMVLHLMVAGRLRYLEHGAKIPGRVGLCAFDFSDASLIVTEASKKKRASLHIVRGTDALNEIDPGGIDVMSAGYKQFKKELLRENHTLKRTMTDPHVFSGIGNAYSDEILHRAKLSPVKWTSRLSDDDIKRLLACTKEVLAEWTDRLRKERGDDFPKKVTAFHKAMAVHGKYKQRCPACSTTVQRIVRGESEVNYCPGCQTDGKLLADRALSRLLRGDWPKTLEELEERKSTLKDASKGSASDLKARIAAMNRGANAAKKKRAPAKSSGKAPKLFQTIPKVQGGLILLAHGAGASSSSVWMKRWAAALAAVGKVTTFDYPYMAEGRKRPDRHDTLVEAHLAALKKMRGRKRSPVILIGKSMGGRMGCHVALETEVDALVCLGYPLVSPGKKKKLRNEVLLATTTPIIFVQGTRDKLCPLDELAKVRAKMRGRHALHVVETGDHSLMATKTWLKQRGKTQAEVDATALAAIAAFLTAHIA